MDHIELQWHDREEHHLGRCKELHILINGQSLIDLVRPVELPFAAAEGAPERAGQYGWLSDVDCEIQHLKTEECMVLGCNCGIPDCWPLTTRVSLAEDIVCWSRFQNWHRTEGCVSEGNHSALGPFVFDRQQYEDAVRGLQPGNCASKPFLKSWKPIFWRDKGISHERRQASALPHRMVDR